MAQTPYPTISRLESLAGDSARLSSVDPDSELARALQHVHSTHLASLLRAVLVECNNRRHDERLPRWTRDIDPVHVPFI